MVWSSAKFLLSPAELRLQLLDGSQRRLSSEIPIKTTPLPISECVPFLYRRGLCETLTDANVSTFLCEGTLVMISRWCWGSGWAFRSLSQSFRAETFRTGGASFPGRRRYL